jgi:hypothetical protein
MTGVAHALAASAREARIHCFQNIGPVYASGGAAQGAGVSPEGGGDNELSCLLNAGC